MTTYLERPSTSVTDDTPPPRRVPTWVVGLTGVVTVLLVGLAVGDVVMRLSGLSGRLASVTETTMASSPVAVPEAPAVVAVPEFSVIATPCAPMSTDGVTADGSVAHCVPLQSTDTYLWSLTPGELVSSTPDPALTICMEQTLRSAADCGEYLARPSNPGDGGH
ncbi:MAG: hypothetical protein WBB00_04970 [Mycobacterium sp.]